MSWRNQYPDLSREIDSIKANVSVLSEQIARMEAEPTPARRGRPRKKAENKIEDEARAMNAKPEIATAVVGGNDPCQKRGINDE